jgi:hypothetical protein
LAMPPGITTLSISIFNLVHYGVDDRLAGICLVQLLGSATFAAIGTQLIRHHRFS